METPWEILGYLCSSMAGAAAGAIFTRKKYNAEVKGEEVRNFDAAIEAYKKMYEDMIHDLKEQNGDLKEEVAELKVELAENRKQIMTLTNFVLASAIKRADGDVGLEDIKNIIK